MELGGIIRGRREEEGKKGGERLYEDCMNEDGFRKHAFKKRADVCVVFEEQTATFGCLPARILARHHHLEVATTGTFVSSSH